jgi:hypothetical protein
MTEHDFEQVKQAMYDLAVALGRTGKEQNALIVSVQSIILNPTETPDYEGKTLSLLGLFYDGMAYGNWPWTKAQMTVKKDKEN